MKYFQYLAHLLGPREHRLQNVDGRRESVWVWRGRGGHAVGVGGAGGLGTGGTL